MKQGTARLMPRSAVVGGDPASAAVAITFDDGPHPEQTPLLLEALSRQGALATFFLQGDHAAQWPQWAREIHRAGHQVANHSYSHMRASDRSAAEFVQEVEKTQGLLQDILGTELARDYRPPYGDITARTFLTLASRGYRCVFWTKDSDDSVQRDADALVAHVVGLKIGRGDIVLFHEDYAHSVAAMPKILRALHAAGLTLQRVDRLAQRGSVRPQGISS
ncbi:MAG: polysaccharide deacetylase family protein [Burkholderiaceae bacterium]